jgi:hypothetical protein
MFVSGVIKSKQSWIWEYCRQFRVEVRCHTRIVKAPPHTPFCCCCSDFIVAVRVLSPSRLEDYSSEHWLPQKKKTERPWNSVCWDFTCCTEMWWIARNKQVYAWKTERERETEVEGEKKGKKEGRRREEGRKGGKEEEGEKKASREKVIFKR